MFAKQHMDQGTDGAFKKWMKKSWEKNIKLSIIKN